MATNQFFALFEAEAMGTDVTTITHTFKFYLDPALAPDMNFAKVVLPKYVEDMNYIMAKNTTRRFAFDPNTGIILTSTTPYTQGNVPPTTGFEVWAYAVKTSSTSNGGFMTADNSGAAVLAGFNWFSLYDRDVLATNTPELRDYWIQINNMLHELGHVYGAAIGEYYTLGTINDNTGVAPTLNISLANVNDSFWVDKPDFRVDVMLKNVYGQSDVGNPLSHAALLSTVKYSNLTAADMNGPYRQGSPANRPPSTDLQHINVKIVDNNTLAAIPNANVKVWSVTGGPSYTAQLMVDGLTDSNGTIVFAWGGGPDPHNSVDLLRLIKVYASGYTSKAKYVSIFDTDISKMVRGENTYVATIGMS